MGKRISTQRLVYEKRDSAVLYNGAAEFPAGGIVFTLSLNILDDPQVDQSLPANLEAQAIRILVSFRHLPSPTPTPG